MNNGHDFLGEGFHRLDPSSIHRQPPRIKWGPIYQSKTDEEKVRYLEKLAATMNHAAHLIQSERDQLGKLCERKEAQIESMKRSLDSNNTMIQAEITRMNAERQDYNKTIAALNAKIRVLEVGRSYVLGIQDLANEHSDVWHGKESGLSSVETEV